MLLIDVDLAKAADGIVSLFKQLGWERGVFFMLLAFMEWRLHQLYKNNIADKQLHIDRLERQNESLTNRLTQLLDKNTVSKPLPPVSPNHNIMWYLLLTPIVLLQLRAWFYLSKLKRDEQVKFRFCELHDRAVNFLCTDESLELSISDYKHVKSLLEFTRMAAQRFEQLKPTLNFRTFLTGLRTVSSRVMKQEMAMETIDNKAVQGLYSGFAYAMVHAFFAFTPFLRHQLFLQLIKATARVLKAFGNRRFSRIIKEVQQTVVDLNRRDDPSLCMG